MSAASPYKLGELVEAWHEGRWYEATITSAFMYGPVKFFDTGRAIDVWHHEIDCPGLYHLVAHRPDETIAAPLHQLRKKRPPPDWDALLARTDLTDFLPVRHVLVHSDEPDALIYRSEPATVVDFTVQWEER